MNENQNQSMEAEASEDLFFEEDDLFSDDDGGNQSAEETSEEEGTASEETETEPAKGGEEAAEPETPPESTEELFDLKYMKETKQVNRQEVVELAQKGMDYDRAIQQRDSLRNSLQEQLTWRANNEGVLSSIEALAKQSGVDVPEFVRSLRTNMLMKQDGLTRNEAHERILREDAEKKLAVKEQADLKTQEAAMKQTRAQKEIAAFNEKYPDVDVKSIPQEVFQRAASGETSLIGAYAEHLNSQLNAEIKKLQAELAAEKQNKINKQKTAGSARTEGANAKYDDFLDGLNS